MNYYIPDVPNLGIFNNIDKSYVIGDLHGDVKVFLEFLKSIKIIKFYNENVIDNFDIYNEYRYKYMKTKDIINHLFKLFDNNYFFTLYDDDFLIDNFKNSCIIQLGDITDTHNVDDCLCDNDLINNDIFIYIIIAYIDSYIENLNIDNFHIILIVGNHDLEHIICFFKPYNYNNIKYLIYLGYEDWLNYILNNNEINNYDKYDTILYKFVFRHYILETLHIYRNTYYIVSVNNLTYFSHTLFFINTIIGILNYKDVLSVKEENVISQINNIYNKILWINIKKNQNGLINKKYFYLFDIFKNYENENKNENENENNFIKIMDLTEINRLINLFRAGLINRTFITYINCNNLNFYDFENYKYHFIGHEIFNKLLKLDITELYAKSISELTTSKLNIYYSDIGLSKSINNIDLNKTPYYFEIEYNKNDIIVKGCSNTSKSVKNYDKKYYQKLNNKIVNI